jgi:hypothetical protein
MTTNQEIIEQENIEMAHYKSLTPDEQTDREMSLMDKARKDERNKVLAEIAEKEGKPLFTPVTAKEIMELLKFPDTQITMTVSTLKEILEDDAKMIFAELDAIAWQRIETDKLEDFANECFEANDKASKEAILQKFSIIAFSVEEYYNIKKRNNVD